MAARLPPHFIDLVYEALLKSFWYKNSLRKFLRRTGIPESLFGDLPEEESKRDWLDRIFPKLEESESGKAVIQQMAHALAEQTSFPDLARHEDSAEITRRAREAVAALGKYLAEKRTEEQDEHDRKRIREAAQKVRAKSVRSQADLARLRERLDKDLCPQLGTQKGGYAFQDWFYDFMAFSDVEHRRPYMADGRQIDGSITIDGTTYLVELKFTSSQADAPDIDSLLAKVSTKADNTMGIMVSMSGYSSVAIAQASFARTPLLLFDHSHLYMVLGGIEIFPDMVRRVRRHSSQTGCAFLPTQEFGGHHSG
jgi:hypothetical protein